MAKVPIKNDSNQLEKSQLRFLTCGSVDDGKSTLIGRILYDACAILSDQLLQSKKESDRYGTQGNSLDLALLVDGLQAEREQGITIDVAYRFFETKARKFIAVDTPGHEQYTRNMVTGASNVDLAIILVDAKKGVLKQTKRHSIIIQLLGIKKVILAINKMDTVSYSERKFNQICDEYATFARKFPKLDFVPIPISALKGDGITSLSRKLGWKSGPTI